MLSYPLTAPASLTVLSTSAPLKIASFVVFLFQESCYKQIASVDQLAVHFSLDG